MSTSAKAKLDITDRQTNNNKYGVRLILLKKQNIILKVY